VKLFLKAPPRKESRRSGPRSRAVELSSHRPQKFGLLGQRGRLVCAFLKFDASDGSQQTQLSARHSVRIGDSVTAQPLPEVLRLADVENRVIRVAHDIHAGALRHLSEEVAPQPLDEWLRVRKKKLLGRGHGEDLTLKSQRRTVQVGEQRNRRPDKQTYCGRASSFVFIPVLHASFIGRSQKVFPPSPSAVHSS
jgi:hypothetical protein